MKKCITFLVITCILLIGCFSNAIIVKADYCPYWLPDKYEHEWYGWENDGWEEISGFTCDKERVFKRVCCYCDKVETKRIPPTNHKWSKWSVEEKPTYFDKGYKGRECIVCGKYDYKTLKKKRFTKQQKRARAAVNKLFKAAKKFKVNKMNRCFCKKTGVLGYPKSKKVAKIIRKRNKKKLKYELIAISGHGKSYSLKYKVTFPDLGKEAYKASYYAHQFAAENGYSKIKKIKKFAKYAKKYKGKTLTHKIWFDVVKTKKGR